MIDTKAQTPTILQNHDKWLALAKKSPTEPMTVSTTTTTTTTPHKPHPQQTHNTTLNKKPKELISPSVSSSNLRHASPPPAAAAAPAAQPAPKPQPQAFDINVIYNQINNQRKLKEQQVKLRNLMRVIALKLIFTHVETRGTG